MDSPEILLSNLEQALDAVDKAKKAILMLGRDSKESIHALYRLAIYMLHSEHDLEGSSALLSKLAACTLACDARTEARISYALMLWTRQKYNDAIALLSRVVSEESAPSHYQALALDYLSSFMREHNASKPAIAKVDEQRIAVLKALMDAESDKKVKDDYKLRLETAQAESQG